MAPKARSRQQQDDDDDEGLSESQRAEISEMIGGAVSGLKKKLPGVVAAAIAAPLGELRTLLERGGRTRRRDDDEDIDDRDDDEREDDDDREDDPPPRARGARRQDTRAARRGDRDRDREPARGDRERDRRPSSTSSSPEIRKMRQTVDKLEREREQERQAARNAARDTALREQLTNAGVDKNRIRGAVAVLRDAMRFDDKADEWVYVSKRDGVDEDIDLAEGVKEWASTDEGKSYLAPAGAGGGGNGGPAPQLRRGAGTRSGPNGPRGTTNPTPNAQQARQQTIATAQQTLAGAIDALSGGAVPLG